jgi:hypothetical protein
MRPRCLPATSAGWLIGAQAFLVAQLGLRLGARLNERAREGAERLAGLALLGLGVLFLVERAALKGVDARTARGFGRDRASEGIGGEGQRGEGAGER